MSYFVWSEDWILYTLEKIIEGAQICTKYMVWCRTDLSWYERHIASKGVFHTMTEWSQIKTSNTNCGGSEDMV